MYVEILRCRILGAEPVEWTTSEMASEEDQRLTQSLGSVVVGSGRGGLFRPS